MKELNIPVIYQDTEQIGYGGNQEWFTDKWARQAGCASVLASNLYAYYHQQYQFNKNTFLEIMQSMYTHMTPGAMGYPFLYKFARTFVKLLEQEHIYLTPVYQKKSHSYEHALSFVLKSINEGHPVGMLILHHQAQELKEDNWHWICLSGYQQDYDNDQIIFSDCGERRVIDARILLDTHHHNVFKMVRMKADIK